MVDASPYLALRLLAAATAHHTAHHSTETIATGVGVHYADNW